MSKAQECLQEKKQSDELHECSKRFHVIAHFAYPHYHIASGS